MTVKDQLNRTIYLPKTPQRIVSLVPSQTELLADLGLKNRLVGITKFCVHPKSLRKEVSVVGGTKNCNYEKIKNLNPDLIICNKEENTLEMVKALESIGPVWISDIANVKQSLDMIERLGSILNVADEALKLVTSITSEMNTFLLNRQARSLKKVVYLIWKNPYMAAGNDTFIDSLLEMNRFENIISEKRYPRVSTEQLKNAELVLLSSEPFPFQEKHVTQLKQLLDVDVQLVDGEYFSWYGSRLKGAFRYFETLRNN